MRRQHVENPVAIFGPPDVLGSRADGEQWLMQAEPIRIAAAATPFVPGVNASLALIARAVPSARADLVVLPEGVLGGYLAGEEIDLDGPEIARLCEIAGDTVVCAGFSERGGYSSAICV